jgi:hypothetical protein
MAVVPAGGVGCRPWVRGRLRAGCVWSITSPVMISGAWPGRRTSSDIEPGVGPGAGSRTMLPSPDGVIR